jgi:hypothetical protein
MKMPKVDRAVLARRCEIAERLPNVVGREWILDAESERRPYESDGLMAYSALPPRTPWFPRYRAQQLKKFGSTAGRVLTPGSSHPELPLSIEFGRAPIAEPEAQIWSLRRVLQRRMGPLRTHHKHHR